MITKIDGLGAYASKANRAAARARGIAPVIPYKANEKDKPAFFAKVLYKAHPYRTGHRRRKTLQACRPAVRENGPQLSKHRQLRSGTMLDTIRPHGLAGGELALIAAAVILLPHTLRSR